MKKYILVVFISIICTHIFADLKIDPYFSDKTGCFILYDLNHHQWIEQYNQKRCNERIPPNSTFKIPLSLMALDQKLINPNTQFKWDGKDKGMATWNHDQTPKSWLTESVVWVSQSLTPKIGLEKIKKYLKAFNYGNQDFSGDPGQNNGLTHAWLSSSLKISANEQFNFLKRLVDDQLSVSKNAMNTTKENMYLETSPNGWKLYGKTGSGHSQQNNALQDGWFVGFITKANQNYLFVTNFSDLKVSQDKLGGGIKAKSITKEILKQLNLF